jgi:hypothetical protein
MMAKRPFPRGALHKLLPVPSRQIPVVRPKPPTTTSQHFWVICPDDNRRRRRVFFDYYVPVFLLDDKTKQIKQHILAFVDQRDCAAELESREAKYPGVQLRIDREDIIYLKRCTYYALGLAVFNYSVSRHTPIALFPAKKDPTDAGVRVSMDDALESRKTAGLSSQEDR